mmetsp:Transcript_13476/g.28477  ORF Transcript_13476/g.28477 Transcript_13476/m.28477 type:complete len:200 (-) Transcript_13476:1753-2352(-)
MPGQWPLRPPRYRIQYCHRPSYRGHCGELDTDPIRRRYLNRVDRDPHLINPHRTPGSSHHDRSYSRHLGRVPMPLVHWRQSSSRAWSFVSTFCHCRFLRRYRGRRQRSHRQNPPSKKWSTRTFASIFGVETLTAVGIARKTAVVVFVVVVVVAADAAAAASGPVADAHSNDWVPKKEGWSRARLELSDGSEKWIIRPGV